MISVDPAYLSVLLRLVVALILGGAIGFERAGNKHDAGLRTHILVCVGAATVMVTSQYIVEQYGIPSEIMRMGAQVISGIGFLGVGCIITNGDKIKGLTTAAGLWATACVGLTVGAGLYAIAFTVVALMLFAILGLRPLAAKLQKKSNDLTISISLKDRGMVGEFLIYLNGMGIETISLKLDESEGNGAKIIFETQSKKAFAKEDLIGRISAFHGVEAVWFL